jgi:hypothetical protein
MGFKFLHEAMSEEKEIKEVTPERISEGKEIKEVTLERICEITYKYFFELMDEVRETQPWRIDDDLAISDEFKYRIARSNLTNDEKTQVLKRWDLTDF